MSLQVGQIGKSETSTPWPDHSFRPEMLHPDFSSDIIHHHRPPRIKQSEAVRKKKRIRRLESDGEFPTTPPFSLLCSNSKGGNATESENP